MFGPQTHHATKPTEMGNDWTAPGWPGLPPVAKRLAVACDLVTWPRSRLSDFCTVELLSPPFPLMYSQGRNLVTVFLSDFGLSFGTGKFSVGSCS